MRSKKTESLEHNGPNPFSEQPKRRLSTKTVRRSAIVVGLILLAAGVYFSWPTLQGWFGRQENVAETEDTSPLGDGRTARTVAIQEEVTERLRASGAANTSAYIDEQLLTTDAPEEKATLYTLKISVGSAAGLQVPDLLTFANQAEAAYPTFETALNVAEMEYAIGNMPRALEFYKLYLSRSLTDDGEYLDLPAREFYENRVAELEAGSEN